MLTDMFKLFWSLQFFARGVLDAFKVAVNNVEFAAIHYHHWTRNRFPFVGNHSSCEKRPNSWFSIFYEWYAAWDIVCCIVWIAYLMQWYLRQKPFKDWLWLGVDCSNCNPKCTRDITAVISQFAQSLQATINDDSNDVPASCSSWQQNKLNNGINYYNATPSYFSPLIFIKLFITVLQGFRSVVVITFA